MKFNKRKKTLKKSRNNNIKDTKNINDSEIESDDILSSVASDDNNLALLNKKKKLNNNISDDLSNDDITDNENSNDDEQDDIFNNPEERKIYLAKKYLKDLGVHSSDKEDSSESSVNSDNEEKSSKLSDDFSCDENEEKKKKISKLLMEKEKSKNRKSLLNLGNKIKLFYDEKLFANLLNSNKKDTKNINNSLNNKIDERAIFFRGHKKSVTCVACPDFNLSFLDHYDYTYNKYKGYNNGKFYEHEDDNNDADNYSMGWHGNMNRNDNNINYIEKIVEPKVFANTSVSTVYTGGKDACIIEWDITKGEKVHIYKGCSNSFKEFGDKGISHFKSVMDIYCHKFNSFFISVGSDNLINIWDNRAKGNCINSVVGHKNIISGVTGCNNTDNELNIDHNFFTSSYDKTIKLWDLRFFDKCINTYLGHTNDILNMNSISENKLITSSSDYTLRAWNTKNDNHILFNINYEIIESCCTLNNRIYIAGTFSGHIYIFTSSYKKPICTQKNAHGTNPITALISIPFTNIFISGSYDGYVHFWEYKYINKIAGSANKILSVQVDGTINKFSFSHNYKYLFIAIGNEMKHGTWTRTKNKNGLVIIPLHFLS